MVFGLLRDLAGAAGSLVGSVLGVASAVIAEGLGITVKMVDEAKKAGCTTYEEIREYWKLD